MRALWRLWLLPVRRSWIVSGAVALLLMLAVFILAIGNGRKSALAFALIIGAASYFWHLQVGATLSGLLQTDTRLIPGFQHKLLQTYGGQLLLVCLLPGMLAWDQHLPAATVFAGVLTISSFGLALGLGSRISGLLFFAIALVPVIGKGREELLGAILSSAWMPLVLVLISLLLIINVLAPRLRLADQPASISVYDVSSFDRRSGQELLKSAQLQGALGKRLNALLAELGERAVRRSLTRSTEARWRAALIHNDDWLSQLAQWAIGLPFAALICWFLTTRGQLDADDGQLAIGYVIVFVAMRYVRLHRGLMLLRPNLAEMYFAACANLADFQRLFARSLTRTIWTHLASALVYAALVAYWVAPAESARLLAIAAAATLPICLIGIGLVLLGQDGRHIRSILFPMILLIAVVLCSLIARLFDLRFQHPAAQLGTLALLLPFAGGFYYFAAREHQRTRPNFEAVD